MSFDASQFHELRALSGISRAGVTAVSIMAWAKNSNDNRARVVIEADDTSRFVLGENGSARLTAQTAIAGAILELAESSTALWTKAGWRAEIATWDFASAGNDVFVGWSLQGPPPESGTAIGLDIPASSYARTLVNLRLHRAIGFADPTSAATPSTGTLRMEHVAVWFNHVLTPTQRAALQAGRNPLTMTPPPDLYWPARSNADGLTDRVSGVMLTPVGTASPAVTWFESDNAPVDSPDLVPPVLSAPAAGTPGTTSITISATSDRASDGTMRFLRRVGGSAASAATIASTGESQAATANPQSRLMTGFTAGSANNYVDIVQVGAGGNSNVVSVGPFTMASAAATAVTLSGPSGGVNGTASTNFTVGANGAITGSLVVTPSAGGGGGTFSPTSVTLTSGSPTATFTYTPASTGAKTISVTNGGGLANPSAITYTVSAAAATALTATIAAAAGLTGIRGVVLSAAAPGPDVTVIHAFNDESFDGSGNISIPVAGLGVPQGQYRWVDLTQSNGDPAQSPAPFGAHGPLLAS